MGMGELPDDALDGGESEGDLFEERVVMGHVRQVLGGPDYDFSSGDSSIFSTPFRGHGVIPAIVEAARLD